MVPAGMVQAPPLPQPGRAPRAPPVSWVQSGFRAATVDPDGCQAPLACTHQWSRVGGQAFSTSACTACGSHSRYSVSRSAEKRGRAVRVALCLPASCRADPPTSPRSPGWPHPIFPPTLLLWDTRPDQAHIWGFCSKPPARHLGSWLSWQQGLSGGSLSWAAACGWDAGHGAS